jgi:hypothetical protein
VKGLNWKMGNDMAYLWGEQGKGTRQEDVQVCWYPSVRSRDEVSCTSQIEVGTSALAHPFRRPVRSSGRPHVEVQTGRSSDVVEV